MKIGYLGPVGTFSNQAADLLQRHYAAATPESDVELVPFVTIEEVFSAVRSGRLDEGVVPIENSTEGIVNATYDTLIFDDGIYIKRHYSIPVVNNLMVRKAPPGGEPTRISRIYSHPQPLGQCRRFLREHYPSAELLPVSSTAEAARWLAQEDEPDAAAIANSFAAEIYGLHMIARGIQEKDNRTDFAVITGEDTTEPKAGCRLTLAFSTEQNEPGSLGKVLDIFSLWDLNLTSIFSRPMKDRRGEYVFTVDLESCSRIQDIHDALTMVRRKTIFYKLLGSYPIEALEQ